MQIKLVAMDMDGTLLDSNKKLPADFMDWVRTHPNIKTVIAREASMAFGDYLNDTELLKGCEESYCMENGHPDLKALAKHVTDSNDNNGVMKILYGVE